MYCVFFSSLICCYFRLSLPPRRAQIESAHSSGNGPHAVGATSDIPVPALISILGSASERANRVRGSLGKVGSLSPVLLPHVIGQVRYGRVRKGNAQVLEADPSSALDMSISHSAGDTSISMPRFQHPPRLS